MKPHARLAAARERMRSAMMIGILSDTHGLLRPEACARLAGVDHIIHAGDIGRPEVIAGLRQLAPTTAIGGNIDPGPGAKGDPPPPRLPPRGRSITRLPKPAGL